jgi:endoglucanase
MTSLSAGTLKRVARFLAPLAILVGAPLATVNAVAGCIDQPRLTGVNLAGAEFNTKALPGLVFTHYTYPSAKEISYIAEQGANIIRLPFRWERLQLNLWEPLNPAELGHIRTTVKNASTAGLCVLLDLHNYAKYYGYKLGDPLTASDASHSSAPANATLTHAFIHFWLALAREFPDPNQVAFGLMNEPANISLVDWALIAKQTLAALRNAQASNLIFIGGGRWSGVHDWFAGLQNSNASEFADLHDPLNRAILDVHQYTDSDYSGTHSATTGAGCRPADEFNSKFERLSEWANTHKQKLFLGEFGVPRSEECIQTLTRFLELMDNTHWHGWTYWAAGSWWGNYPLALSGTNQPMAPQWNPLKQFFYRAVPINTSPPRPPTDTGNP